MPVGMVAKTRGKAKRTIREQRQAAMRRVVDGYREDVDVRMLVIQDWIPLGLKAVAEELQREVKSLAGAKHRCGGDNARWGSQNGSVYLRDQKFPVQVPRVRTVRLHAEVPLETSQRLPRPVDDDTGLLRRLVHGLSPHTSHESASLAAEVFGSSASNVSKRFTCCSADTLKQLQERSLAGQDVVVVFIDAKRYAHDGIMVGLGVTMEGKKIVLGVEQMGAERAEAVTPWCDRLLTRGLRFEPGVLCIIDGSQGIRKAIDQTRAVRADPALSLAQA